MHFVVFLDVYLPWYYIGPFIAVAIVVLLVTIICLVRRVLQRGTLRFGVNQRSNLEEKKSKVGFCLLNL